MNPLPPPTTPPGVPVPPPPGPPPPPPSRRLVRLTDQSRVGGVAAGLGWYFGIDPTLVRIGWVVATLATGIGIPAYIVAWVLLPEATSKEVAMSAPPQQRDSRSLLIVALSIIGATMLLGQIRIFSGHALMAAIFIGLGVLLFTDKGVNRSVVSSGPYRSPGAAPLPPPAAVDLEPQNSFQTPQSAYEPYAGAWNTPPPPARHVPDRPKSILGRLTVCLWLLVLGAATLITRLSGFDLTIAHYLALTVATIGVGLQIGTVAGRARWLIPVGIVGTLLLVGMGSLTGSDIPIGGRLGQSDITVTDIDDLQTEYNMLAGQQTLDFSDLDLEGTTASVSAGVLAGEIIIVVPADVGVSVDGSLRAGDYDVLGTTSEGTDLTIDVDADGAKGAGQLNLTINGLAGQVDVQRVERR